MLSVHDAKNVVFFASRLDYCNALLSGCANASLKPLQLVKNAADHVLTRTKCFEQITPVLASLHWLPITICVDFKVLLIILKAFNGLAPPYLKFLLQPYFPAQTLCSQKARLLIVSRVGKCTGGGLPIEIRGADSLDLQVEAQILPI